MSNWKELDGMDEEVPADLNLKRMIDSIREVAEDVQIDRAEAIRATVVMWLIKDPSRAAWDGKRLVKEAAIIAAFIMGVRDGEAG